MLATISTQSLVMSPAVDHPFSWNSNSAGAPLPLIPRRAPASRSISASSIPSTVSSNTVKPASVKVEQSRPSVRSGKPSTSAVMAEDSDTSSSSSSDSARPTISRRSKKSRGVRIHAACSPEEPVSAPATCRSKSEPSTVLAVHVDPTGHRETSSENHTPSTSCLSTSQPRIYAPGMSLRLSLDALKSRTVLESSKSAPVRSTQPTLVRKKSGQLVKSSLKSSKPVVRGSLSVVTQVASSKSAPNTPTPKAVHFDAHLEHVKLFLAEQKPLAVSRDGSPTDDTSGTDSDFPSFIYGDSSNETKSRRNLVMNITSMPSKVKATADVALEELQLSPDLTSILGRVRVRNIAFQKWVAVRFTFDSWQTTSEVTGKYVDSIDSAFDRFSFSIRLNDILARIEGKTLILAVRYTVDGKEIWDNNEGQNYVATFTKVKAKQERPKSDDEEGSVGKDIADLKVKLEQVARGKENHGSARPAVGKSEEKPFPLLKTGASLASRYDFGTSLKSPWKPSDSPPPHHARTHSYPAPSIPTSSSIPWPQKSSSSSSEDSIRISPPLVRPKASLGSPRDVDEEAFLPPHYVPSDPEGNPFPVPSREQIGRNHQRGYFDLKVEPAGFRRTPPGTPRLRSLDDLTPLSSPRHYSFPLVRSAPLFGAGLGLTLSPRDGSHPLSSGGSSESTPSIISPSNSSRSESPSTAESFMIAKLAGCDEELTAGRSTDYHQQLLERYCFFTGGASMDLSLDSLPRALSVSSVEELLTTSPRIHAFQNHQLAMPIRSTSLDSTLKIRSGSTTPTTLNPGASEPRSASPIAAT